MDIYRPEELSPGQITGSVCAIGNFDGVHLGHQQILKRLLAAKDTFQAKALVYTFEPHPIRVLNPDKGLKMIFSYEQRLDLLQRYQPDGVVVAKFSWELAGMAAEDFVRDVLVDLLRVRKVVVGYDFNFGRGGDGNARHLSELGVKYGFEVEQVPAVMYGNRAVSSSRIRRLIAAGEIKMVREMLGRPFFLVGTVEKGKCRGGSLLGFPTANLSTQQEIIPAKGVYAAYVRYNEKVYQAAVNVGNNPTFENGSLTIEAHILDFDKDIYGQNLEIHFVQRLRDERKFESIDRLKSQMFADVEKTRALLGKIEPGIVDR